MNVTGGATVTVYRTTKDRFGDTTDDTPIGTISGCIFQPSTGLSTLRYEASQDFQETASIQTMLWAPRNADIKLQDKDRITLNGRKFRVVGDRAWDDNHPVTRTAFSHYAVEIQGVQ
ncbi:hypothetical protein [Mycobacterium colombiense]|uniref:hypothetical protein n=1 Tax=Mycobacterium colombiense TaxID=339268 RepID=UPI00200B71CE|nr:hypothetical protein [Mycobacterium colombiense]MCK8644401.1 hypothetical protein [Mycobacterium colombiense]